MTPTSTDLNHSPAVRLLPLRMLLDVVLRKETAPRADRRDGAEIGTSMQNHTTDGPQLTDRILDFDGLDEHSGDGLQGAKSVRQSTSGSPRVLQGSFSVRQCAASSPKAATRDDRQLSLVTVAVEAAQEAYDTSEEYKLVFDFARRVLQHRELFDYPHRRLDQAAAYLAKRLENAKRLHKVIDLLGCEDRGDFLEEVESAMKSVRDRAGDPIREAWLRAEAERIELQDGEGKTYPADERKVMMLAAMLQIRLGAKPIALPVERLGAVLWPKKTPEAARRKAGRIIEKVLRLPDSPMIRTRKAHHPSGRAAEYVFDFPRWPLLRDQGGSVVEAVSDLFERRSATKKK